MARPPFLLRIVDQDGEVVTLPGGGALERDLLQLITGKIVAQGVGVFKTQAMVKQAIEQGLQAAILELKSETRKAV